MSSNVFWVFNWIHLLCHMLNRYPSLIIWVLSLSLFLIRSPDCFLFRKIFTPGGEQEKVSEERHTCSQAKRCSKKCVFESKRSKISKIISGGVFIVTCWHLVFVSWIREIACAVYITCDGNMQKFMRQQYTIFRKEIAGPSALSDWCQENPGLYSPVSKHSPAPTIQVCDRNEYCTETSPLWPFCSLWGVWGGLGQIMMDMALQLEPIIVFLSCKILNSDLSVQGARYCSKSD